MIENIDKIAEKLSIISSEIIAQYTYWYFLQALILIMVAFPAAYLGTDKSIKAFNKYSKTGDGDHLAVGLIWGLVVLVAVIIIMCNVPTLFFPKAMAIHELIKDIR